MGSAPVGVSAGLVSSGTRRGVTRAIASYAASSSASSGANTDLPRHDGVTTRPDFGASLITCPIRRAISGRASRGTFVWPRPSIKATRTTCRSAGISLALLAASGSTVSGTCPIASTALGRIALTSIGLSGWPNYGDCRLISVHVCNRVEDMRPMPEVEPLAP